MISLNFDISEVLIKIFLFILCVDLIVNAVLIIMSIRELIVYLAITINTLCNIFI